MTSRWSSRRGVLISMRYGIRRTWLPGLLVAAVGALPAVRAEADILWEGDAGYSVSSTILVGQAASGSLTVNGGSVLTVSPGESLAGILIGGNQVPPLQGQGIVTIDGVDSEMHSRIDVTGPGAVIHVGRWGTESRGDLIITNGGALTSTVFNVGVGDWAGSNGARGTVLVDGPGSSVTLSGSRPNGDAAIGDIGGDQGSGTVTVSNGATVAVTSVGATSGGPGFIIGTRGGTGAFNIESGAVVTVDGTGVTGGTGPGFVLGNAGTGTLNVTGGSSLLHITANPFGGGFTVGQNNNGVGTMTVENEASVLITGSSVRNGIALGWNPGSRGTLNVATGATVTLNATSGAANVNIGRGGTGSVMVTGGGTSVLQDALTEPAELNLWIGFDAGSDGTLTIQDGAVWTLNGTAPEARPNMLVGRAAGSTGTLEIKNGGQLTLNRGLTTTAGCCITVGQLGHGVLRITGGGRLTINDTSGYAPLGNAVGIGFGGDSSTSSGGTFEALISGQGSALTINAIADGGMSIGRNAGSAGTMTVENGATVSLDNFSVGRGVGSLATLNVSGATMSLVGDAGGRLGAVFWVGSSGEGHMNVTGGSVITIDGTNSADLSGVYVGGGRLSASGGTGFLTVSGGSVITAQGQDVGFTVGFDATGGTKPSTGTLTVDSGGQILLAANGRSSIGSTPGSTGTVTVTGGGSLVDAGAFLGIGRDRDGNLGGTGTLTVSEGGTVRGTLINCGAGGTINGNGGILIGEVIADPACVISPGGSPGTLSIIGSLTTLGAKVILEVDAFGNHDVLAVEGTAVFDPATQVEVRVDPAFRPPGGTTLQMVQVQPTPQDPVQPLLTLNVAESGGGTVETQGDLASLAQPPIVVPDISIPPTIRAVQIDIKPGAFPNVINLGSAGAIPVAILSTPAFDALTVDPLTITLDGAQVKLVGKGQRPLCSAEDVNGDGRKDLLCHIVTSGLPEEGDGVAVLDAMTFPAGSSAGIPIRGADFVRIVP